MIFSVRSTAAAGNNATQKQKNRLRYIALNRNSRRHGRERKIKVLSLAAGNYDVSIIKQKTEINPSHGRMNEPRNLYYSRCSLPRHVCVAIATIDNLTYLRAEIRILRVLRNKFDCKLSQMVALHREISDLRFQSLARTFLPCVQWAKVNFIKSHA